MKLLLVWCNHYLTYSSNKMAKKDSLEGAEPKGVTNGSVNSPPLGRDQRSNNIGRRQAHKYHGKNHKGHKKQQRYAAEGTSRSSEDSFDTSIVEELNSGNYIMKGRKAQVSINHLLQLQFPEIKRTPEHVTPRSNRRRQGKNSHIHLHGDSFINANYRILADNTVSYKEQSNNPNVPVPREHIVRVVVPPGQNCPICLSEEPVAPRMVICGHIFCLSCLLNFFSVEETVKNKDTGYVQKKKHKECPLCGSILRSQNFKPVLFEDNHSTEKPQSGKEATMQLMCRPHGSMLPLPVNLGIDPLIVGDFPPVEMSQLAPFCRMMMCSATYGIELLQKDIDALKTQYEVDKVLYNDDGKYYKMAIEQLNDTVAGVFSQLGEESVNMPPISQLQLGTSLKSKYNESNAFFFFQTSFYSSTRYFLSPLDVKILLFAFQRYSEFPAELKIIVENVTYDTVVTEELIARYKYLSHLPLGTEIAMIDVDWRSSTLIPKEVQEKFAPDLRERRRKLHMRRQKEEKQKRLYEKRVEKEHADFYRRENGGELPAEVIYSGSDPILDSLRAEHGVDREHPHVERTIWGTSIPLDEHASRENEEFEAMLRERMQQVDSNQQQSSGMNKKDKKKKNKLVLFSSNHQTF